MRGRSKYYREVVTGSAPTHTRYEVYIPHAVRFMALALDIGSSAYHGRGQCHRMSTEQQGIGFNRSGIQCGLRCHTIGYRAVGGAASQQEYR